MNTIFNNPFYKKKFFFLIAVLLLCGNSIAQVKGPFLEIPVPPLSVQIWTGGALSAPYKDIVMNTTSSFDSKYDGILVSFTKHVNTSDNARQDTLASFRDLSYFEKPIISIFYSDKSVTVRRRYQKDPEKYYDYKVYDQLFEASAPYEVKLYVTASFIFIVTQKEQTNEHYLSSVFFGLNIPNNETMEKFLSRNEKAIIRAGGSSNTDNVSNVRLSVFSYNYKTDNQEDGKYIYEGLLPNIKNWNKKLYVKTN